MSGVVIACAACSTSTLLPGPRNNATVIVVERGWHTDVCLHAGDAGPWIMVMTKGFDGAQFLCFGFGDRQYVVNAEHGPLAMLSALFPSRAALLMTVLKDSPAAAFGASNTVPLPIDQNGLIGLQEFLRAAVETDTSGLPLRLADGPYVGSVFFAATGTYDGLYTCNTWTASALHAAGLPVDTRVLFAGGVMRQARRLAATGSSRETQ